MNTKQEPRARSCCILIWTTLMCSICAGSFGFALNCFGQVAPTFLKNSFGITQEENEEEFQLYQTIFNGLQALGATSGNIFSGQISQRIGRRYTLMISCSLGLVGCVLIQINVIALACIARFLIGLAFGSNLSQGLVYLAEIFPGALRKTVAKFPGIFVNIFNFLSQCLSFGFPLFTYYYRFYMLIIFVIYLFPLIMFLIFIRHDTPYFLMLKGKKEQALKTLEFIYKKEDVPIALERVENLISLNKERSQGLVHIFRKPNWRRTVYGLILTLTQSLAGISIITLNLYVFVEKASTFDGEVNNTLRTVYSMIYGLLFLVFSTLGGFFVNIIGRKKTIIIGGFFQALSHFLFGLFFLLEAYNYLPISLYMFCFGFCWGFGPMLFILIPELCESYAVDISYTLFWAVFIIMAFFGMVTKTIGFPSVFFPVSGFNFCIWIFFIFFIRETKGKSKAQIIADYYKPPILIFKPWQDTDADSPERNNLRPETEDLTFTTKALELIQNKQEILMEKSPITIEEKVD